jgi:hypothetical protein
MVLGTSREAWIGLALLGAVSVALALPGQETGHSGSRIAMVHDWSHQHVVFSNPATIEQGMRVRQDPRFWQQHFRRNVQLAVPAMEAAEDTRLDEEEDRTGVGDDWLGDLFRWRRHRRHRPNPPNTLKRDWAVSLGPNATVGAGNYPAKFSFDVSSANCGTATQPDFVVFNTSVQGSGTQASIVAYDNLYTGCPSGAVPSTYWSYTTGGAVVTSVVLSLDGSQVAFVQTGASSTIASLILLKWAPTTDHATSITPDSVPIVTASQYPTCPAPCMVVLPFSGAANDTNSSPFYDYANDVLYAGDDNGALHKFHPVFTMGPPAEVGSPWPVTLASGLKLTSPVFDGGSGKVFVGSGFTVTGSQLFAVSSATGSMAGTSSSLGKAPGITSGTLVDSSTGEVFAFVGNDASTACSGPCSAVYQFSTSFTSGTGTKATVGFGGSFPLYNGNFDNAYYTSANGTGNLYVCGGGGFSPSEPALFKIPINSGTMSTSSSAGPTISNSNVACSPLTEVFNPAGGGMDRIFGSVTNGSDAAACSNGGCIGSLSINNWQPSTGYAVGQQVLDPANFLQVVATGGTSKSGSAPSWMDTCGLETTDNGVTWVNSGFLTPVTPQGWQTNAFYSVGARIIDSNNNYECALATGIHTGILPPTWNTTIGGITTEITGLQWRNGGPTPNHSLPASGGTSGIIMDNVVGSGVLAGASQVYFSTLGTGGGCGAGNGCAVQASQAGLN